ncbi:MAG: RagB/SusD family nutrient uptake outer membrane protein, partial [Mediterranea sp.]|nr:RagB/SusD family nutrient uptake outer membrane protein [Mediterranea sp.]
MKKILYVLGVSLLLTGCAGDYMETEAQSSADMSTVFETTANAELAINGLCRMMVNQYIGSQGFNGEGTIKLWYGNMPGNDFQKSNNTGMKATANGENVENKTSTYTYYPWFYYYKIIGNANTIINTIDESEGKNADKQFIKAQALTFRAYCYTMLLQIYAYRWQDSNNGSTRGVPLRLDDSKGDLAASTVAEVYQQIYNDLDEAITNFTNSQRKRANNDFYSPDISVAYAIYARAALIRQDWNNAAKYAELARSGYSLMSNSQYLSGFNTSNKEWIWGSFSATDQTLYYYSLFAYQGANSSATQARSYPAAISKTLYDKIPATDIRKGLFLEPKKGESFTKSNGRVSSGALFDRARKEYGDKLIITGQNQSLIYTYMQFKFLVLDQPGIGNINHFRAAEMYLIQAEANCHIGGKDAETQKLLETLNKERDEAYTCAKTGSDLLEEVKLYRKIELWGEGF